MLAIFFTVEIRMTLTFTFTIGYGQMACPYNIKHFVLFCRCDAIRYNSSQFNIIQQNQYNTKRKFIAQHSVLAAR